MAADVSTRFCCMTVRHSPRRRGYARTNRGLTRRDTRKTGLNSPTPGIGPRTVRAYTPTLSQFRPEIVKDRRISPRSVRGLTWRGPRQRLAITAPPTRHRHEVVTVAWPVPQRLGIEVGAVRPLQDSRFHIQPHRVEKLHVLQRAQHLSFEHGPEVDLLPRPVREVQTHACRRPEGRQLRRSRRRR